MPVSVDSVASAEARAARAESRARQARARAAEALEHAHYDAAKGWIRIAVVRRSEAEMHERSAARQDEAAALHRLHVAHLRLGIPASSRGR